MRKGNKQHKNKKHEIKSKEKKTFLIIPIIILICIIGITWFVLSQGGVAKAQLIVESGNVYVKHSGGVWMPAENNMDLFQSDSIKTGENSSASIILFKSSIIRLDSNTEVTIQEIIQEDETNVNIHQKKGRTWNSILKISGIDDYEVQTPTTIASIRGTAFVVIVWENGSSYYGVSHGILNVSSISNNVIQDYIDVSGNESVFVFIDMIKEKIKIKPFEIDEWVLDNLIKDQQFVMDLKAELYLRLEDYFPELKAEFGINDEEIDALLEGYILGYFDLPEDTPEWIEELFEFS